MTEREKDETTRLVVQRFADDEKEPGVIQKKDNARAKR